MPGRRARIGVGLANRLFASAPRRERCPPCMQPYRPTFMAANTSRPTGLRKCGGTRQVGRSAAARTAQWPRGFGKYPSSSPTCTTRCERLISRRRLRRARDHEFTDLVDRLLTLRQQLRKYVPDVGPPVARLRDRLRRRPAFALFATRVESSSRISASPTWISIGGRPRKFACTGDTSGSLGSCDAVYCLAECARIVLRHHHVPRGSRAHRFSGAFEVRPRRYRNCACGHRPGSRRESQAAPQA